MATVVSSSLDVDRIRYPTIIYTTDYANDPISFKPERALSPISLISQSFSSISIYNRDFANFYNVNFLHPSASYLPVETHRFIINENKYKQVMKDKIQFVYF